MSILKQSNSLVNISLSEIKKDNLVTYEIVASVAQKGIVQKCNFNSLDEANAKYSEFEESLTNLISCCEKLFN